MIVEMGDRFPVLIGLARSIVPCLLLGSGGCVSTGPELFGAGARRLFDVHDMTPAERMDLHYRFGKVILAVSFLGTSPSGIKAGLNMIGLPAGVPRAPVQPLSPEAEATLRDVLVEAGVLEGPVAKRA
jgi:4-hydroxy-tetrahydrodipicolinate synthase